MKSFFLILTIAGGYWFWPKVEKNYSSKQQISAKQQINLPEFPEKNPLDFEIEMPVFGPLPIINPKPITDPNP